MVQRKQPARMGRYANLAHNTSRKNSKGGKTRSSARKKGRFAWFRNLSRGKKILVILAPILLFLILTPIITYLVFAGDIQDQERLMNRNNTGIVLTDRNDKVFYSIGKAEPRNLVKLENISKDAQNALIATEDKDFYRHGGFSIFSIIRAAVTGVGGGSTLTQQLAKNTVLTDDHSYFRKYQELAVAVAIEQNYSKDQILEMYLNSVFYGENAFGIEDAAKTYFGIEPKDLNLAQSSMLIGLLPAPNAYSPISGNAEYAKQRQNVVLSRMVKQGYITEEQKTAALAEQLSYASDGSAPSSIAPLFVETVLNELSEKYGYETVMRSGFRVKTTLDYDAQVILNESVAGAMPYINRQGGSNAGAIVIDPKNGEIRAYVGSADYSNETWGKVDMVTRARQPGSTMKSIYYAYAMADGVITPASIWKDEKTDFGGGYTPQNADRKWHGDVTTRRSIAWSLNIPSIKIMQQYGVAKSVEASNRIGLDLDPKGDYNLTLAIGSVEVPLIKMTNAYAAFANQGAQYENSRIAEVKDKFGKSIYKHKSSAKQVISKEGAYLISSILSDNAARAGIFGSSLTVPGYTVAVKTGTTDDSRDAWTIGYNTDYVFGAWVGNNDNAAMKSGGSDMAGPIFRNTMSRLMRGRTNTQFAVPAGIVQRDVCSSNGGLATESGKGTYKEYFMAGALPTKTCEPEPTMISVCVLATKKIEEIDEKKFDAALHSREVDDCKTDQVQVCDIAKNEVITIDEDDFDSTKHNRSSVACGTPGGNTTTPLSP